MRPVQPILMILMIGMLFLYFSRLRSSMLDRAVVFFFAMVGIVMAAMPDLTQRMAESVGVGRGADLFMYMSLLGLGFFGLVLYSKLRHIENTMTELTRSVAIQTARFPSREADAERSAE